MGETVPYRYFDVFPVQTRAAFPYRGPAIPFPVAHFPYPLLFCVGNSGPAPDPFPAYDPGPPFLRYSLSVFGSLNRPYSRPIMPERDDWRPLGTVDVCVTVRTKLTMRLSCNPCSS
jgi:hypothetical protein